MMKLSVLAQAAILGLSLMTQSLQAQVCLADSTKPFSAGAPGAIPGFAPNGFAEFVVDSEGYGLVLCTDPVNCFFDPVIAGNAYSEEIGLGGETFWFLADSVTATTGPAAIDALLVMGVEAAFAVEQPTAGLNFPFTRLRTRIDVNQPGQYKVEHPWGERNFTVTEVADAQGPLVKEINETIDIEFRPNAGGQRGSIGPWLRWTAPGDPGYVPGEALAPAGYLGDGPTTLHTVIGSPCGRNHVRISATNLAGTAGLAIDPGDADGDGSEFSVTNRLFTVQGKLAEFTSTPLNLPGITYSRAVLPAGGTETRLNVFAEAPSTAIVTTANPNGGADLTLATDNTGRYFSSTILNNVPVPLAVSVNAIAPVFGGTLSTASKPVTDEVNITAAQATCTIAAPKVCSLTVSANSSDRAAAADGGPTLTLTFQNQTLSADVPLTLNSLSVLPAAVTVRSDKGGTATKAITVVNQ